MNPFKAAGFGALLYIFLCIVSLSVMYTLGIPFADRVLVFAAPLFCIPLSYFYLRDVPDRQFMESIEVGFLWAVINLILDVLVCVTMFGLGWDFFNSPLVWIKYGELILFTAIIGVLFEGGQEKTPFKEHKNETDW